MQLKWIVLHGGTPAVHQSTAASPQHYWREVLEQQRLVVSLLCCVMTSPVNSSFRIQVCLWIQHAFDYSEQDCQKKN